MLPLKPGGEQEASKCGACNLGEKMWAGGEAEGEGQCAGVEGARKERQHGGKECESAGRCQKQERSSLGPGTGAAGVIHGTN